MEPKRVRRRRAEASLVMAVATSHAVTAPGNEEAIRRLYDLTEDDMAKLKERIGARLEAWAIRLDDEVEMPDPICEQ